MSHSRRILKDIYMLESELHAISAQNATYNYFADNNDLSTIYLVLKGPEDTPYEYGFYLIKVEFPINYPFKPPKCTYLNLSTIRQSPNFHDNGQICLSRLNTWQNLDQWSPTYNVRTIITTIQGLVLTQNPANNEPPYNFAERNPSQSQIYDNLIRFCNYKYNINMMADLDLDSVPSSICQQIRTYVRQQIQFNQKKILHKLSELTNTYDGITFTYYLYRNTSVVASYNEELLKFKAVLMCMT